ncbi:alpha/beta hydrolase [Campylobacter sp.]|uniref:alpha/beta hydrolase n=1 Tax=Campylobacter sp. TaxID=205 RepID=UPI0026F91E4B|nr:alpha/beta hydrolase-fold protein [Campylobacter sp.]
MVRWLCAAFLVCLLVPFILNAKPKQEVEVIRSDVYDKFDIEITSMKNKNGEKYLIYQAIPKGVNEHKNVLFMLDANAQFPMLLNLFAKDEKLLVIGIGHDTNLAYDKKRRTKDYTPKANKEEFSQGGGAEEFYEFIKDRVVPFADKKFNIKNSQKSLYGHSFGGLFTLFSMLKNDDIFDSFFIASPSLWWGDSMILKEAVEKDKFKERLKAKFVFVSVGELEKRKGKTDRPNILKAKDLALYLNNSGINSEFKIYKNQTHAGVIPLNLADILKRLCHH